MEWLKSYPPNCLECGYKMRSAVCSCGRRYDKSVKKRKYKRGFELPTVEEVLPNHLGKNVRKDRF